MYRYKQHKDSGEGPDNTEMNENLPEFMSTENQ